MPLLVCLEASPLQLLSPATVALAGLSVAQGHRFGVIQYPHFAVQYIAWEEDKDLSKFVIKTRICSQQ